MLLRCRSNFKMTIISKPILSHRAETSQDLIRRCLIRYWNAPPGSWFNIMMSYQYKNLHGGDKTFISLSDFHKYTFYTETMISLMTLNLIQGPILLPIFSSYFKFDRKFCSLSSKFKEINHYKIFHQICHHGTSINLQWSIRDCISAKQILHQISIMCQISLVKWVLVTKWVLIAFIHEITDHLSLTNSDKCASFTKAISQ